MASVLRHARPMLFRETSADARCDMDGAQLSHRPMISDVRSEVHRDGDNLAINLWIDGGHKNDGWSSSLPASFLESILPRKSVEQILKNGSTRAKDRAICDSPAQQ